MQNWMQHLLQSVSANTEGTVNNKWCDEHWQFCMKCHWTVATYGFNVWNFFSNILAEYFLCLIFKCHCLLVIPRITWHFSYWLDRSEQHTAQPTDQFSLPFNCIQPAAAPAAFCMWPNCAYSCPGQPALCFHLYLPHTYQQHCPSQCASLRCSTSCTGGAAPHTAEATQVLFNSPCLQWHLLFLLPLLHCCKQQVV